MKRLSVLLLVLMMFSMGQLLAQDTASPDDFSGALALEHVADQVDAGMRMTATAGSLEAGNRILSHLSDLGWETSEDWHLVDFGSEADLSVAAQQTFEDWQPLDVGDAIGGALAEATGQGSGAPAYDSVVVPVRNLVASMGEGSTIIIGAHYDSRIYADHDPDPALHREPVPGANDAGSGVGVLMELARVISEHYTTNVEIRLVFFDAEDNGRIEPFTTLSGGFPNGYLIGSTLYANSLNMTTETIQYMLLVDMIGDFEQQIPIEGYSAQYAPEIANAIWTTAADLGYGEQFITTPRGPIIDDHVPFLQRGILSVDLIDLDYPYWHTTADTLDKVSPDSLERVGRTLLAYLEDTGAIARNTD